MVSDGEEAVARAQFKKLGWGEALFELIVGADSGARAGSCGRVAVWPAAREHAEGAGPRGRGAAGCRAAGGGYSGGCSQCCSGGRELGVPKPPRGREHATHPAAPTLPRGTQPTLRHPISRGRARQRAGAPARGDGGGGRQAATDCRGGRN